MPYPDPEVDINGFMVQKYWRVMFGLPIAFAAI
jgi:hypothetical protein